MTVDPYVAGAAGAFLAGVAGVLALAPASRLIARGFMWARLRATLTHAGQAGPAAAARLPGDPHGEAVVVAAGRAAIVTAGFARGAAELEALRRAVVVQGRAGWCGLMLEVGGRTAWVVELEEAVRVWARLQQDGVPVEVALHPERESLAHGPGEGLAAWLRPGERVTQLLRTRAVGGVARDLELVVTDRRVGLQVPGDVSYQDWLGQEGTRVTIVRRPDLDGDGSWELTAEPAAGTPGEEPPTLTLGQVGAELLIPLVALRCPTTVALVRPSALRQVPLLLLQACVIVGFGFKFFGIGGLLGAMAFSAALDLHEDAMMNVVAMTVPCQVVVLMLPGLVALACQSVELRRASIATDQRSS